MWRESDGAMDAALAAMKSAGVTAGEIFLEDYSVFTVSVSGGRIESLETQDVRGGGLRVFERGRFGFAYTADLSPDGLSAAIGMARGLIARATRTTPTVCPRPTSRRRPSPRTTTPRWLASTRRKRSGWPGAWRSRRAPPTPE